MRPKLKYLFYDENSRSVICLKPRQMNFYHVQTTYFYVNMTYARGVNAIRNSNAIFHIYPVLYVICSKNHKRVIFASKVAILSSFHEREFLSHHRILSSCVQVCRANLYMHYYIHIVTCPIFCECDMSSLLAATHRSCVRAHVTIRVYVTRERIQTYYPISDFIRVSASHVRVAHPRLLPGGFITCCASCPSVCVANIRLLSHSTEASPIADSIRSFKHKGNVAAILTWKYKGLILFI